MSARPISLRLLLALCAGAAQLCLPVVHAASMASSGAGAVTWCGNGSASQALQAQLRALAADVRDALQASDAQCDHVKSCAQLCSAMGAPALPEPGSITMQLREAGLEPALAGPVPAASQAHAHRPPPRGPPSYS